MGRNQIFRAIITGAPGSGKGTISSKIIKYFHLEHISSGDLLRNNILKNTDVGIEAKKYTDKGLLVPDEIVIKMIEDKISGLRTEKWLLDGFPRTLIQAQKLSETQKINVVINLVVPFSVIIQRLQGRLIHPGSGRIYNTGFLDPKVPGKDDITGEDLIQRPDDKPEAVKRRLDIYKETIGPVLDFYKQIRVVQDFHGETSAEIWPQVEKYLLQKM